LKQRQGFIESLVDGYEKPTDRLAVASIGVGDLLEGATLASKINDSEAATSSNQVSG
jgi:hypothetical protein